MSQIKPLSEMSPTEIAQLTQEQFRELAASHNDGLELREASYQRDIDRAAESSDQQLSEEMDAMRSQRVRQKGISTAEQERRFGALSDEFEQREGIRVDEFLKDIHPAEQEADRVLDELARDIEPSRNYDRQPFLEKVGVVVANTLGSVRETLLEKLKREASQRGETLEVKLQPQPERTLERRLEKDKDRW